MFAVVNPETERRLAAARAFLDNLLMPTKAIVRVASSAATAVPLGSAVSHLPEAVKALASCVDSCVRWLERREQTKSEAIKLKAFRKQLASQLESQRIALRKNELFWRTQIKDRQQTRKLASQHAAALVRNAGEIIAVASKMSDAGNADAAAKTIDAAVQVITRATGVIESCLGFSAIASIE